MAELNCNDLATVCRLEIADAATSDALARRTMEICRKAVNGSSWAKMLCHADIDDIVIIASARAIKRLAKWDRGRAAWVTYVSVITRSTIQDHLRYEHRRTLAMAEYAKHLQIGIM
jgi:DNA-directed RNA polymerase specialized sigma24 family protein